MDSVRIFTHPSPILRPDYHFVLFLATMFEFENILVLRNFCPELFLKKSPVLSGFPTQHFSKF